MEQSNKVVSYRNLKSEQEERSAVEGNTGITNSGEIGEAEENGESQQIERIQTSPSSEREMKTQTDGIGTLTLSNLTMKFSRLKQFIVLSCAVFMVFSFHYSNKLLLFVSHHSLFLAFN